jgi:hypothetical protein
MGKPFDIPPAQQGRVRLHQHGKHRCYVCDLWIRGEWQQVMGGYKTARAARQDLIHFYGYTTSVTEPLHYPKPDGSPVLIPFP